MENKQDSSKPSLVEALLLGGMLKANQLDVDEPSLVWLEPVKPEPRLKAVK
jgi:hypothetical protein